MTYQDQYLVVSDRLSSSSVELDTDYVGRKVSYAKRFLDLVIAVITTIVFFPLILLIALLVKIGDGGKTIYFQERIGRNGREFKCYKFRTMVENADAELAALLKSDDQSAEQWQKDQKLKKDPRVTRIGKILRKTSLDELPQLWNILIGDMSVVGPRPIIREEVPKYGQYFEDYISVLPGVTGLWQISGRNDTTYAERVLLDVEYTKNNSVLYDLKIILLTVPAVLVGKGAY